MAAVCQPTWHGVRTCHKSVSGNPLNNALKHTGQALRAAPLSWLLTDLIGDDIIGSGIPMGGNLHRSPSFVLAAVLMSVEVPADLRSQPVGVAGRTAVLNFPFLNCDKYAASQTGIFSGCCWVDENVWIVVVS